ncbi:MAG TPA: putative metallopeptidase [Urbifossiella sp.]|nr:putative metallopeptidase [Urbifossiella sp.]
MGKSVRNADPDTLNTLARVMRLWHPDLTEAGVQVGVIMVSNTDGDAIKSGGYAVLACIKPVGLKDRLPKEYDAELQIDEHVWDNLREEQRLALLDHELCHINLRRVPPKQLSELRRDDPLAPWWQLDDLDRPKLKSVPGDWNAGDGFKAVVERHGKHAIEYLNLSGAKAKADECRDRHDAEKAQQKEDAA